MELTPLKCCEIAAKVGFDDPAYFTRVLTRIMGV